MIHPAPKPSKKVQRPRFWRQKDPEFRKWIRTENVCLVRGYVLSSSISPRDYPTPGPIVHDCWGPIDPAHVGKHQAQGVEDFGNLVPLCRAAHRYYDEHRSSWAKVTGYTEAKMQKAAAEYALRFLETGGLPRRDGAA